MDQEKFDYYKAKFENISCNLCGRNDFFVLAEKSVSGLPVRTCLCKNCGMIYINPRLTKEEYDNYYKYFYRKDRAEIKKHEIRSDALERNFENARKFGRSLGEILSQKAAIKGDVLDVGSSTGGILRGLKDVLPEIDVFGIEPSIEESDFANQKGVKTETTLFENFNAEKSRRFAAIFCIQSLNHLLDPKKFFDWCFENLEPEGCLVLAVKNFRGQCRRAGSVWRAAQVDHPFMFVPETLKLFTESAGFEIIYFDVDEWKSAKELRLQKEKGISCHHIRLIARKKKEKESVLNVTGGKNCRSSRFWLSPLALKIFYYPLYANKTKFLKKIYGRIKNGF